MTEHPTLYDAMMEWTDTKPVRRLDPKTGLRKAMMQARRFVLDDAMSTFLADLSRASFPTHVPGKEFNTKRSVATLEGMRMLSRLPHKVTWVEFNLVARAKRAEELQMKVATVLDRPSRAGWLLMQHPQIETAFMCFYALSHTIPENTPSHMQGQVMLVPEPTISEGVIIWRSDNDGPLPWFNISPYSHGGYNIGAANLKIRAQTADGMTHNNVALSEVFTGVRGYNSNMVGLAFNPFLNVGPEKLARHVDLSSSAGEMRYVWSFLSTLNDLPMTVETKRPAKGGYYSRGAYRKFVEHQVIHLTIPGRVSLQTFAKRVVRAARRRAHMVRGHWREDWRHPISRICTHEWESIEGGRRCKLCHGKSLWIAEHQRGDAGLGFVTHDYVVEKGNNDGQASA